MSRSPANIKTLLFIIAAFASLHCWGQKVIDSLENELRETESDSTKVNLYISLINEYSKNDPGKALEVSYHLKNITKAKHLENKWHGKGFIKALYNIGYLYRQKGGNDSASYYYNYGLKIAKKTGDTSLIANGYTNTGYLLYSQGETIEASERFKLAREIYIKLKDSSNIVSANNNLGSIFFVLGNKDKAIDMFTHSIKIAKQKGRLEDVAILSTNIGKMYQDAGNHNMSMEYMQDAVDIYVKIGDERRLGPAYNNLAAVYQYKGLVDSSLFYLNKALKYSRKFNDVRTEATALHHLGGHYRNEGELQKAIEVYEKSLALKEKIGINTRYLVTLHNLGKIYYQINKPHKAIDILEKGHEISIEKNLPQQEVTYKESLSKAYKKAGKYKTALNYHEEYTQFKDSLTRKNNDEKLAELEAEFNKEKRELEIQNLKKQQFLKDAKHKEQLKREHLQKVVFAGGFGLALVLALIIFRGLRQKQRSHRIIEAQKGEVELQKNKVEEKNKEIVSSINYAQRIQNALLKSEEHITEHFPPHFIMFKPKDIVSGDFYWAREMNGYYYLTVADCTGHGVPGAFMSMLGIAYLNEITGKGEVLEPSEILNQLREKIINELGQKGAEGETRDGMDISMVRMKKSSDEILWSGANNPLWIISKNPGNWPEESRILSFDEYNLIEIKGDKQPIGFSHNIRPFTSHKLNLNKGDEFYLFSDGYADQFGGPKGKKLKYKPMKKLLVDLSNKPMKEKKKLLNQKFENWKGDLEQIDDVCIVGLKV